VTKWGLMYSLFNLCGGGGNGVAHVSEVALLRAGLVLGWVTVRVYRPRLAA